MVPGKNVKFSCEKSPSPKRFVEPEGMTDVDLRRLSQLSGFSDSSFKKFDQHNTKKNLCKIFSVFCVLGALICVLFLVVNRVQLPWRSWKTNMLVSEYLDRFERCKLEKTLEACCSLMGDNDILEDCTAEKFLEISKKLLISPGILKQLESEINTNDLNPELLKQWENEIASKDSKILKQWDTKDSGTELSKQWENEKHSTELSPETLKQWEDKTQAKDLSPELLKEWEPLKEWEINMHSKDLSPELLKERKNKQAEEKNKGDPNLPVFLQDLWGEDFDATNENDFLESPEDPYGEGVDLFGEGVNSFGEGVNSFGKRVNPFGEGVNAFGEGVNKFGERVNSFGEGVNSFYKRPNSFGEGVNSFDKRMHSFGEGVNSFHKRPNSFGEGVNSFDKRMNSFGEGVNSFGGRVISFGEEVDPFGEGESIQETARDFTKIWDAIKKLDSNFDQKLDNKFGPFDMFQDLRFVDYFPANGEPSTEITNNEGQLSINLDQDDKNNGLNVVPTPKGSAKSENVPKIGTKIRDVTKIGSKVEDLANIVTKFEEVPKISTKVDGVPKIGTKLEDVQKIGTKVEDAQKIGTKVEDVPTPNMNNTNVILNKANAAKHSSKAKRQILFQDNFENRRQIPFQDNFENQRQIPFQDNFENRRQMPFPDNFENQRQSFDWSPQEGIDWYHNAPRRPSFYNQGPNLRPNFRDNWEEFRNSPEQWEKRRFQFLDDERQRQSLFPITVIQNPVDWNYPIPADPSANFVAVQDFPQMINGKPIVDAQAFHQAVNGKAEAFPQTINDQADGFPPTINGKSIVEVNDFPQTINGKSETFPKTINDKPIVEAQPLPQTVNGKAKALPQTTNGKPIVEAQANPQTRNGKAQAFPQTTNGKPIVKPQTIPQTKAIAEKQAFPQTKHAAEKSKTANKSVHAESKLDETTVKPTTNANRFDLLRDMSVEETTPKALIHNFEAHPKNLSKPNFNKSTEINSTEALLDKKPNITSLNPRMSVDGPILVQKLDQKNKTEINSTEVLLDKKTNITSLNPRMSVDEPILVPKLDQTNKTEINSTEALLDKKINNLNPRMSVNGPITVPKLDQKNNTIRNSPNQNVTNKDELKSYEDNDLFSSNKKRINEGTKVVQFGASSDQALQNVQAQCIPSYSPPVGASMPLMQQQVPFTYDSNAKFAQMIPINAAKSNPMWSPQYYVAQTVPQTMPQQYPFMQTPATTGQYFICNPIQPQVNNIAGLPGVEVRQSSYPILTSTNLRSSLRESSLCAFGQKLCGDASKCIKKEKVCDGEINCSDGSDEAFCSCKLRIGIKRICDGYYDCPNGEDEVDCYGCDEGSFNCDDWSYSRSATCIPFEKRCDGVPDCPTGKDEKECSVLLDTVESSEDWLKISSSSGFLHRNFKGKWYPACSNSEAWATDVCKVQTGPNAFPPLIHMINIDSPYFGEYANSVSQRIEIVGSCEDDKAVFVECPPPTCGLRKTVHNPYRNEEVDTSEEEILERYRNIRAANGTDDVLGDGRVVGGKPCQPGAWPWVVSIYKNGAFHCGGALISESWLVTAAHCVEKYWMYYYEIEIGMLRRFSYSPMQQTRHVSHVIPHGDYDRGNLKNDIAIMKMHYPVKYNQYVRPICLPTQYTAGVNYGEGPSPGTVCTAVGWGATVEHGSDPDQVREVEVPVLPICKHKEDSEGREICAGLLEGGKDACQGDSGGPFLCRNPNFSDQWYLAGVVSHGEGCARPNEPGVYTRVPLYREWIYEHAKDDNLQQRQPLLECPGYSCKVIGKCIPKAHRCDKVIDCLYGDDEVGCERRNSFTSLFKQAMRQIFVDDKPYRSNQDDEEVTTEFDTTEEAEETTLPVNQSNGTTRFLCRKMLEVIPIEKKCDKVIDCQDGTDEESCVCVDYLRISHPAAICDGVTDCADLSDERDCASCGERSFHCRLSGACVPIEKKCDNRVDCEHEEDEWDCVALSDTLEVEVDNDGRPLMSSKGLVMISSLGEWKPLCGNFTGVEGQTAADVCVTLGFSDYESYLGLEVGNDSCSGLHVKCADVRVSVHEVGSDHNTAGELYNSPWSAAIYADGEYVCTGTVLNPNWILTSINCFPGILKFHQHYVAVLLGAGRGHLSVGGPHEQIIPVAQSVQVPQTDSCLLRLSTNLNITRYVRPLHFQRKSDFVRYQETCTALGRDEQQSSAIIHLRSIQNCSIGSRCFKRINVPPPECKVSGSQPWSGSVVCNSGSGFYPAATFYEPTGICGFNQTTPLINLGFVKNRIITAMEQTPVNSKPPQCAGFRCALGNCVEKDKICNGVSDCRDAEDESPSACEESRQSCHLTGSCVCGLAEMRCSDGRCVQKSTFCDRYSDCEDGSDEPDRCTCQAYLRLADPKKICDGVRNCFDRSDEDPNVCRCSAGQFHCGETSRCVPNDMVCDGHSDCPGSEDETHCYSLKSSEENPNSGEVMTRTSGIWHQGCFPPKLTTGELEDICSKLGFTGNSAAYFNATVATSERPIFDDFRLVWIHRKHSVRVNIILRNGDKPYVTFKEDPECYRLFIKCL